MRIASSDLRLRSQNGKELIVLHHVYDAALIYKTAKTIKKSLSEILIYSCTL